MYQHYSLGRSISHVSNGLNFSQLHICEKLQSTLYIPALLITNNHPFTLHAPIIDRLQSTLHISALLPGRPSLHPSHHLLLLLHLLHLHRWHLGGGGACSHFNLLHFSNAGADLPTWLAYQWAWRSSWPFPRILLPRLLFSCTRLGGKTFPTDRDDKSLCWIKIIIFLGCLRPDSNDWVKMPCKNIHLLTCC